MLRETPKLLLPAKSSRKKKKSARNKKQTVMKIAPGQISVSASQNSLESIPEDESEDNPSSRSSHLPRPNNDNPDILSDLLRSEESLPEQRFDQSVDKT